MYKVAVWQNGQQQYIQRFQCGDMENRRDQEKVNRANGTSLLLQTSGWSHVSYKCGRWEEVDPQFDLLNVSLSKKYISQHVSVGMSLKMLDLDRFLG